MPGSAKKTGKSRSARRPKTPRTKPEFIEPMQPTLVARLPTADGWSFEPKFDGYRIIAAKDGSTVRLYSRRGNLFTDRYPSAARAVGALQAKQLVLDGEVVAFDAQGRPSFQLLQNAGKKRNVPILFIPFDLLHLEGRSLLALPLRERRELLEPLVDGTEVHASPVVVGDLKRMIEIVRRFGLEGVVAKRDDSRYLPGERTRTWLKQRFNVGQELVIGGFTRGAPFDGLLVGYYEGKRLMYAGKVRGGLRPPIRRALAEQLRPLVVERCPFANLPERSEGRWGEGLAAEKMKECVWVQPKLVARIDFLEWTEGAHLRHPKFVALTEHKKAADVARESSE